MDSDQWQNFRVPILKVREDEQLAVGFKHIDGIVRLDDCVVGPAAGE